MQGLKPQGLTNKELLKYAHLFGYDKLTPEWVQELAKRLEHAEYSLSREALL